MGNYYENIDDNLHYFGRNNYRDEGTNTRNEGDWNVLSNCIM